MGLSETPSETSVELECLIALYNKIIPYLNCIISLPGEKIAGIKRCLLDGYGNHICDDWNYLQISHENKIQELKNKGIVPKNKPLLHCTIFIFDNGKECILSTDRECDCKIPNNVKELRDILKKLGKIYSGNGDSYAMIVNDILTKIQMEEIAYFASKNYRYSSNDLTDDLFDTLK